MSQNFQDKTLNIFRSSEDRDDALYHLNNELSSIKMQNFVCDMVSYPFIGAATYYTGHFLGNLMLEGPLYYVGDSRGNPNLFNHVISNIIKNNALGLVRHESYLKDLSATLGSSLIAIKSMNAIDNEFEQELTTVKQCLESIPADADFIKMCGNDGLYYLEQE